ncbi:hypothetical protein GCM10027047_18330 [Rhodococcus aerolatus]
MRAPFPRAAPGAHHRCVTTLLAYLAVFLGLDVLALAGYAVDSRAWPNPLQRTAPRRSSPAPPG